MTALVGRRTGWPDQARRVLNANWRRKRAKALRGLAIKSWKFCGGKSRTGEVPRIICGAGCRRSERWGEDYRRFPFGKKWRDTGPSGCQERVADAAIDAPDLGRATRSAGKISARGGNYTSPGRYGAIDGGAIQ